MLQARKSKRAVAADNCGDADMRQHGGMSPHLLVLAAQGVELCPAGRRPALQLPHLQSIQENPCV